MARNVLEEVSACFTASAVVQASTVIGESEAAVRRTLPKVVPMVLGSLIKLAERPGGPDVLWTMTREAYGAGTAEDVPAALNNSIQARWGRELMITVLNGSYRNRLEAVAAEIGISSEAVESLASITTPVMLGVLGNLVAARGLDADGLGRLLQSQRGSVSGLMLQEKQTIAKAEAAELSRAQPQPLIDNHAPAVSAAPAFANRAQQWLVPAVLLMAALVVGYFLGQRNSLDPATPAALTAAAPSNTATDPTAAPVTVVSGRYDAATENYIYDTGRPVRITLLDGSTQTIGVNSTEYKLYTFLADAKMQVDPVNRTKGWINFDRVYFDAKKASLTDESKRQLRNVASILKSFPDAHVKIGGYTDTTGNFASNLTLSQRRATAAMAALVNMGVPADHIEAKGYGQKYGVASNETPVGRALNRRISVRVTQK